MNSYPVHPPLGDDIRSISKMAPATSNPFPILDLPTELHLIIIDLSPPSILMRLRLTNKHFNTLIPAPTYEELLEAEASDYGIRRGLYACSICHRLRPKPKFADSRIIARKRKREPETGKQKRFCVDCGLNPPDGRHPYYRPGDRLEIREQLYLVRCLCGGPRHTHLDVVDDRVYTSCCYVCSNGGST